MASGSQGAGPHLLPDELRAERTTFLDLEKLITNFSIICEDFSVDIVSGVPYKCLEFSSKVLYQIGPESKSLKKDKKEQVWRFTFPYQEGVVKTCLVNNLNEDSDWYFTKFDGNTLFLTVKQASVLALITLDKLQKRHMDEVNPKIVLTPLAGSVFTRENVKKISEELKIPVLVVASMVNTSCQPGGEYLPMSDASVARARVLATTSKMKNRGLKEYIVRKTIEDYEKQKKVFCDHKFEVFSRYASYGLPAELSYKVLLARYEEARAKATNVNSHEAPESP